MEEIEILKFPLVSISIFLLFFCRQVEEELVEVLGSECKDGADESIFSEVFNLVLGDGEVARVDLVLRVYSYKLYQTHQLAFVVE